MGAAAETVRPRFGLKKTGMAKEVEQPTLDVQAELDKLLSAEGELVEMNGRKVRIGWLKNDTERKFTHVMLREGADPRKRVVQAYSVIRLDVRSGLLTALLQGFVWWLYWRWLWYVRRDRCSQFQLAVIGAAKKKVQQQSEALALSTILLISTMDTMMTMARHEVGRAGRGGAQPSA